MKRRIVAIVTLCLIAVLSAVGLVACDNTIKQTGISLDKTATTIILGDTDELTATIAPADATDKTVVWTSSNDAVATVEDGTVTAVAVGTATITAKTADEKFSATCAVTVIGSEVTFNTLVKDGDVYKKEVSNATTTFSFVDEVTATGHASFVVATDAEGTNLDDDKVIDLAEGTNVAYVIKKVNGTVVETYQVQIYRKHVYTVTFNANDAVFATVSVDEGTAVSAPETQPTKQGYTFDGWDFDFATLINEAKTIEAKWAPATDTAYTVEYYLENIAGDGYVLDADLTEELEGTTEATVTATPKAVANFTYDASASGNVVSGVVAADGSLVLKLYYTRNTVAITVNAEGGAVAGALEVKYGAQATLTATAFVGYDFAGWYKGEEIVADSAAYVFTVTGATELTAKFDAKAELAGFTFTSTADTCVITGVKDASIYQVVIPSFVTEIADEAFEDCVRLVEVINNSESFVVAKGETTNGSVGKYAYAVANCDADYVSKIQEMEEDGIKAIAYIDGSVIVIIEYTTAETTAMFGQCDAVLSGALAKSVNLEKLYFMGTAAEKAEIEIAEGAIPESVVWYFYSEEVPTEVGNYWYMEVVGETPTLKEWDAATIAKAVLAKELGQAELASLDSEGYLSLFAQTKGTVDSFEIEYLESYEGKTGVIKISGTNANNVVFTLSLPKVMTAMNTGTQTSGQDTIKVKDAEGNPTDVARIFDLTTVVADIYVVEAGTGAFGFNQSIYDIDQDAGWGGKNFTPTLNAWQDYTKDFITADHIRFAVGEGDFEFYVAGIYEGTEKEVISARLASTLGEGELANFDSQDYLKLITNDPVYGGRPGSAEIGSFYGKDNVLRIEQYTPNVYKCPIFLPKNPTGNAITIQFYLEGGSDGFRFGLLGIETAGWMNPNHSTTYATDQWVTVVYTGFDNFASAMSYQMLRFNTDGGTAPDAIYIAGIWDGDQSGALLGKELLSTLGENELANFDSELYLNLIDKHPVYNGGAGNCVKPEASIVDFGGKTGVLKLTDSNADSSQNVKLSLPKAPTQTTITMQVYLVANADDATTAARFGLFKQEGGGWDDTAAGTNHKTDFPRGEWITIVLTEIDNTGLYNYLYICFEKNIDEVYIAGIWDGDVSAMLNPVE